MRYEAIHRAALAMDLSSVGRCALSVAIPVLASMGIQPCPLPTMLLSAHTGGFGSVEKLDTGAWLDAAVNHLNANGLSFDALSVGYLGTNKQIAPMIKLIEANPAMFTLVDPAMADHGKLYSGIEQDRPAALKPLIACADLVIPNATEARLLTGLSENAPTESLLDGLLQLGCKAALITGHEDANAYWNGSGRPLLLPFERIPESYPGTGDLYASLLLGALMRGAPIQTAMEKAATFVESAARATYEAKADPKQGVCFEPLLMKAMAE